MKYPAIHKTYGVLLAIVCINSASAQPFITYQLNYPTISWTLSSVPRGATDSSGNVLFPESGLSNQPEILFNRAKLAWYNIDPLFLRNNSATPSHIANNPMEQGGHYTREIPEKEAFPESQSPFFFTVLTFDLAFYPDERGPYNFEYSPGGSPYSAGIDSNGNLNQPSTRWGGVMRSIDITDFEDADVKYIVFRMLDPFLYDSNSAGGSLFIHLGNFSEDICKDGKMFSEGKLSCNIANADTSAWGVVPINILPDSFSNDPVERACQDVGLDGLSDNQESGFFNWYLDSLQTFMNPVSFQSFLEDPSNDNYHYSRGDDYDDEQVGILGRYKKINNPDGNSGLNNEDLNGDNVLSETEEYFQYRIELKPDMDVGQNFIVEKFDTTVNTGYPDNPPAGWYEFRIPIDAYDARIGNIPDFKAIRFMRIFLTGFEKPVVLRFAELALAKEVGVSVPEINTSVKVFPNPSTGKFKIQASGLIVNDISVLNSLGREVSPPRIVSTDDSQSYEVDMGTLKGIYFVKLKFGSSLMFTKILIL